MRHTLRAIVAAVALGLGLGTGTASAQTYTSRPIDTNNLIVQPADTATNIFTGTSRILSRAVAGTIEDNGFVRSINSLLGRTTTTQTRQAGGLPLPGTYPSTRYKNSFPAAMPTTMQAGTTPTFK